MIRKTIVLYFWLLIPVAVFAHESDCESTDRATLIASLQQRERDLQAELTVLRQMVADKEIKRVARQDALRESLQKYEPKNRDP